MNNPTLKQLRFVDEYLVDLNATRAAVRAGYARNSAHVTGARLLRNAKVRAEIDRRETERAAQLGISHERVLETLGAIAFADIATVFDADGALKPIADIPPETRAALQDIVLRQSGADGDMKTVRIRMANKLKALELLARHLGLFDGPADSGKEDVFTSFMRDVQARRAAVPVRP